MGAPARPTSLDLRVGARRQRCLVWGDAAAPTVLAIHGAGAHAHWWEPLAPHLPGWRLLAPDLRGHGESDWADRYLIEDFGADLLAVLDATADGRPPAPVVLVGHSMGGRVATWLAAHHPARVRALVLLDARLGPVERQRAERWRASRPAGAARTGHPTRAAAEAAFRLTPEEPGVAPATRAGLAARAVHQRADGRWQLRFDRAVLGLDGSRVADLLPLLANVRCPLLVLRGTASTVIGERQSDAIASATPAAVIETVAGGHHFLLAHPAAVGARIQAYLRGALRD